MAKFILINAVVMGTAALRPGSTIDDTVSDVTALRAAGAELWPASDAAVAAAAATLIARRAARAMNDAESEAFMRAALEAADVAPGNIPIPIVCPPYRRVLDAAAGTLTPEEIFFGNTSGRKLTVTAATMRPSTTVAGADATAGTFIIKRYTALGVLVGTVATLVLNLASGGTTALTPIDFGAITNGVLNPGDQLTIQATKAGAGVAYGAMLIDVTMTPTSL